MSDKIVIIEQFNKDQNLASLSLDDNIQKNNIENSDFTESIEKENYCDTKSKKNNLSISKLNKEKIYMNIVHTFLHICSHGVLTGLSWCFT